MKKPSFTRSALLDSLMKSEQKESAEHSTLAVNPFLRMFPNSSKRVTPPRKSVTAAPQSRAGRNPFVERFGFPGKK